MLELSDKDFKVAIKKMLYLGVPAVVQWVNDLACLCGGASLILGPV